MAALALLGSALTAPTVLAAKAVPSTIELAYDSFSATFFGAVASPRRGCERARKVVLYLDNADAPDTREGADMTDGAGGFEIEPQSIAINQTYYAIATRKRLGNGRFCKPQRSNEVQANGFEPPFR